MAKELTIDRGYMSRSKSVCETVNGSHCYTIKGYSLAKGMGPGKYVSSDTFSVDGYQWAVYFYPDGKNHEDNSAYVSVFVALASEGTDVRALFELTLFDQSGKGEHKVHSHFDRAMVSGPQVPGEHVAMLLFMYLDKLPNFDELTDSVSTSMITNLVQHLLAAADRYGLERLRLLCEVKLCEQVTSDNVASTMALAEHYQCPHLKSACLKFAAVPEKLRAVLWSEGFRHLQETCPSLLLDLLATVAVVEDDINPIGRKRSTNNNIGMNLTDGADSSARRMRRRV